VRQLLPETSEVVDVRAAYAVDAERHVRVNFASSADGAVTVDGKSKGLSSDADREVFHVLRALSDVVLVGAGTARAENYGGAREADGHIPPIAVVSRSLDLDRASRLFTDTKVPPIVVTCADSPADERKTLMEVCDVIVAGTDTVDVRSAITQLADRGLKRVICEGGPHLFGWLAAAKAFDELCLTVAPLLAGGRAGRILAGVESQLADPLKLVMVLEDSGHLFLRYSTA